MFNFIVTCHTIGCENSEMAIEVVTEDEQPIVVCGACCVEITDIVAKPAPKKK